MPTVLPDDTTRWRCGHCGNLTRFDVTRSRTTTEYWHFSLAGAPHVEETTVGAETVEKVVCRWCGASDRIEVVPRPDPAAGGAGPDTGPEPALGGTP